MSITMVFIATLPFLVLMGLAGWVYSLARSNVNVVDATWSLFFVVAAWVQWWLLPDPGPRTACVLIFVSLWGLRLSGYLTWRNWNKPEDARYAAIRSRNQPGFQWKSIYIVFLLQAGLAWFISLPLLGAIAGSAPLNALDIFGMGLFLLGFAFEAVGDAQLSRFKSNPGNAGKVLDSGLWRYTRHPNYFGNFCIWWGFYALALGAGAWWTLPAPLLMTFLLLKVSGVALLEKDIGERRPAYTAYIKRTSAFFPWPPKKF
ncbi:MAG: DUF1295 domain-containing protein [Verrucomicrobia bacterium]|nr:DUF1295 domain-containing protein [Verrucomicrobiota bacterium]